MKMANINEKKMFTTVKVFADFDSVKATVILETGLTSICRKRKKKTAY